MTTAARLLIAGCGCGLLGLFGFLPLQAAQERPNVLLIVSDDHHHQALGCAGNPVIQTPNLDALAAQGVRFTHCFTPHPICLPSRACILTGQDSWTNGSADFNETPEIHPDSPLWPELLRRAGYRTFYTGKWHNDGRPSTRGFSAGANIWLGGMYDHRRIPLVDYEQPGSERRYRGKFSSTAFADAVIDFLQQHREANEGTESGKPFAVFLSFTAPHDPWVPPPPYDSMYPMEGMPVPENLQAEPSFELPGNFPCQRDQRQLGWPRYEWAVRAALSQYYGMITQMDAQIGRVLDQLDALDLRRDTAVLFVGDHGYSMASHGFVGKQTMYEEGIRTPLILHLPMLKRDEPVRDELVTLMDLCPTILDLAGVEIPQAVEGISLLDLYQGGNQPDRDAVFAGFSSLKTPSYHQMVTRCVRTRQYKFIQHLLTGETELFDLNADPLELNNLAGDSAYARIQEQLLEQLLQWRNQHPDR